MASRPTNYQDESMEEEAVGGNFYVVPNYPYLPSSKNPEWEYVMRRTMQEIIPGLYLGPYGVATRTKLGDLKEAGITHIVCVRAPCEEQVIRVRHPGYFEYLVVTMADNSVTQSIIPWVKKVNEFLEECFKNGGKALVHGNLGVSRSAALVIGFVMSKFGVTAKEAFVYVQGKRFCCNPNEGFLTQLEEFEPIYRAMHVVPVPLPGTEGEGGRESRKRGVEEEKMEEEEGMREGIGLVSLQFLEVMGHRKEGKREQNRSGI